MAVAHLIVGAMGLLKLCVLCLRLLQDGDVGIGVFPQSEEKLMGDLIQPLGQAWRVSLQTFYTILDLSLTNGGPSSNYSWALRGESRELAYAGPRKFAEGEL